MDFRVFANVNGLLIREQLMIQVGLAMFELFLCICQTQC